MEFVRLSEGVSIDLKGAAHSFKLAAAQNKYGICLQKGKSVSNVRRGIFGSQRKTFDGAAAHWSRPGRPGSPVSAASEAVVERPGLTKVSFSVMFSVDRS
jgi:hypothetical protein